MALLFTTLGNATSIRCPRPTRPYQFSNFALEAGVLRMLAIQLISCAPGVLLLLTVRSHWALVLGASGLGLGGMYALHRARLRVQGAVLEERLRKDGSFSLLRA